MDGLRRFMLGTATAALAVTALGAPMAAADTSGTLAIVQGRPGMKVDICIGGKEKVSGAAYGSVYRKDVIGTGTKVIRFFKQNDRRTCGGTKLAARRLSIEPGDDLTLVLTAKRPQKVVVFDNAGLGQIPPRDGTPLGAAWVSWASAADLDTNLLFDWWEQQDTDVPVTPSQNPVFGKGDRFTGKPTGLNVYRLRATRPENPNVLAKRTFFVKNDRRFEAILVGTRKANARFVFINRGIAEPLP